MSNRRIFISFSGDSARGTATQVSAQLKADGIDAFVDDTHIDTSTSIAVEIQKALEHARLFVMLINDETFKKTGWPERELHEFKAYWKDKLTGRVLSVICPGAPDPDGWPAGLSAYKAHTLDTEDVTQFGLIGEIRRTLKRLLDLEDGPDFDHRPGQRLPGKVETRPLLNVMLTRQNKDVELTYYRGATSLDCQGKTQISKQLLKSPRKLGPTIGHDLWQLLFPMSLNRQCDLMRSAYNEAGQYAIQIGERPLRLRIVTEDKKLSVLPWHLIEYQGQRVTTLQQPWTVETCSLLRPAPPPSFPATPRIDVLAWGEGALETEVDNVLTDLRYRLACRDGTYATSRGWRRFHSAKAYRNAQTPAPLLFIMGATEAGDDGSTLVHLEDGATALADVTLGQSLSAFVVSALSSAEFVPKDLPALRTRVGAVVLIADTTKASRGAEIVRRLALDGDDPRDAVRALLAAPAKGQTTPHWLSCKHDQWAGRPVERTHTVVATRLDRHSQRREALELVNKRLKREPTLSTAVLGFASGPHHQTHSLGRQVRDYVEENVTGVARLTYLQPTLPALPTSDRLSAAIRDAVGATVSTSVLAALSGYKQRGSRLRVLLVDWGVVSTQHQQTLETLFDWITVCANEGGLDSFTALVHFVTAEVTDDRELELLEDWAAGYDDAHSTDAVDFAALEALSDVTKRELKDFLKDTQFSGCPAARISSEVTRLWAESKGKYDLLVSRIEKRQAAGWS